MTKKLTLLFSLILLPLMASAATEIDGIYYNLNSETNKAEVTSGDTKYTGSVNIPETVTDNGVTYSVTSIVMRAFYNCSSLTTVNIPNSVTSIGNYAFSGCSGLTSVTIGNSVTSIGIQAFYNCSSLISVNIPNSVTSIGNNAFRECIKLTSITIPSNVTSIGNTTFRGCYFEKQNFINNSSLDAETNKYWGANIVDSKENGFYIKDGVLLKYTGSEASITIPNSVTSVGNSAFSGCSGLTSIEIPNSVTSIGNSAFSGCSGLTSIEIPNSVTSIGNSAFSGCSGLTKVELNSNDIASKTYISSSSIKNIFGEQVEEYILGEDVTSIGNNAFYGCSVMTSVKIGNSVTAIGTQAFYNCSGLKLITIGNSVTSIGEKVFSGCSSLTKVELNSNGIASKTYSSSSSIKNIFGEQVEEYILGEDVTSIGNYAFYGCSVMTSVKIGNNVVSIGISAFENCYGLTSIEIPNSVISIGDKAFSDCYPLTSITIPNSVTEIGSSAFEGCYFEKQNFINNSSLDAATNKYWGANIVDSRENGLMIRDGVLIEYKGNETSVIIPNSVTSIGDEVFSGFKGLVSVTIPNSVTSIGNGAFYYCYDLTSVHITDLEAWCRISFYNAYSNPLYYAHHLFMDGKEITDLVIPNSVTSIGDKAFYGCEGLTSVTIPNSVTSIGAQAFSSCLDITVTIPNSVKSIGEGAFLNCWASVNITDLEAWCNINFQDATANPWCNNFYLFIDGKMVTDLVIPNSVTSIGAQAFYGCLGLKSVTIPNSVTSIGEGAFYRCGASIICKATSVPSAEYSTFNDYRSKLYVPASALEAYKATAPWNNFRTIVAVAGDTNGDGEINMTDAEFVTNIILGTEAVTEAADVNCDGVVNMADVMVIANYIRNMKFSDEGYMLPALIEDNPRVSIYAKALQLTGVADQMKLYKDPSYNKDDFDKFYDYRSGAEPEENATSPDVKLYGFTAFLVPDEVLKEKYGITDVKGLYDLAADLYKNDEYYKNDVGTAGWSFEHLTDSVNPLRRFMQYHVVNRKFPGYDQITVRDDLGVIKSKNNPTEWYPTLLFSSIAKFEHLTAQKWASTEADLLSQHYQRCRFINRRVDDNHTTHHGIHIQEDVPDAENDALNGIYFYIDDVMVFDRTSDVYNCRMRMDFSTLFPELITNNMRMNGNESVSRETNDHTNKYGRNYYFPSWTKNGVEVNYLDGVTVGGNGKFIYRRPRKYYWSLHGDEFICQGNYDVKFKLPQVPYEGDWQIRLGYAAMPGLRGVCQIYFADPEKEEPVGIPLDMNKTIGEILGDDTPYSKLTETKRMERRKTLKNLGYYYGPNGAYHGDSEIATFADVCATSGSTLRIVLCTKHMKPGVDYYIRMRAISSSSSNNNEAMFDYLEMVPESVYGITEGDGFEDDL